MEVKVNQLSDISQEVEVTLTYEEILPDIESAYKKESQSIQIDGFRKGKAPMSIIKKVYGEAIEYKASEKIATKKFWDVVDQEKLKPISVPELLDIDFQPGTKLFFKIKFEVKPELALKDYKNLEIEKPIFKVKEDEIEREIEYLLKPYYKYEDAEVVDSMDYRMTVNLQKVDDDDNPVEGQRSENMLVDLSDEKVNQQIKDNAQGVKVGGSFPFTFVDEHYHGEELHREEYRYVSEVTKIEKAVKPEINEELLKKISKDKASTLDELREQLKNNFSEYYTKQSDEIYTNNLIAKVVQNNDFTPPSGFVNEIHKRFIEAEKENAKRRQQPVPDEHSLSEYFKPRAEWNAKWQIISEQIANIESIKVGENELEDLAKEESEKTGISVAKLVKFYKDTNRENVLLDEKVVDFLKENNTAKEVDADEKIKENKEKQNDA